MIWLVEVGIQRRTEGENHLDLAVLDVSDEAAAADDRSWLLLFSSAIFETTDSENEVGSFDWEAEANGFETQRRCYGGWPC